MELSERKRKILKLIVESYVATAEPVGSKAIAASEELNLSSATIRNEMAEMTAMGLLEQPHTSAGRIPSPQGYRIYVNELMNEHRLSLEETRRINDALKQKMNRFDELLADAGRLVSDMTSYPVYTAASPAAWSGALFSAAPTHTDSARAAAAIIMIVTVSLFILQFSFVCQIPPAGAQGMPLSIGAPGKYRL